MSEIQELQQRVAELEARLNQYHEDLERSLSHDREFMLGASWGIVSAICGIGAFILVGNIADKLGMTGWILGGIAGACGFIAWGAAAVWADKGREGDLKKLSRLPKWDH